MEGRLVELTGKVELRTFYGPPGYGEAPQTDSRETVRILLLENTLADAVPQLAGTQLGDEITVQLILDQPMPLLREAGQSCLKFSGVLIPRITGHHHTDVLLDVQKTQSCTKQ